MRLSRQFPTAWLFAWVFLIGSGAVRGEALHGAFYHISAEQAAWSAERWETELAWMRQAGMSIIIVASCADENTACYPTQLPGRTPMGSGPLDKILSIADANAMDVHLGLVGSSRWWSDHSEEFLTSLAQDSIAVASELHALYGSHASLKGFYITEEIDNLNWTDETVRKRLVNAFLKPVSDHIKSLDPALIVSEAPFYNVLFEKPEAHGLWWEKTLKDTPHLDLLMPQDGIGVEHGDLQAVVDYFQAYRKATDATGRTLWADVEVFDTESKPAPMARIADQIATVSPFVEKMVIWEFGHYLAPGRSRESLELYLDYQNYRLGNPLLGPISRGTGYVLSSTPESTYPDETAGQLTDGQARFGSWDPVGWKGTSPISITLDLGGQRKNIYQFRALFLNSESLGGSPPDRVAVFISSDGEEFMPLGELETILEGEDSHHVRALSLIEPAMGRFVRFTLYPAGKTVLCSELEVLSSEYVPPLVSRLLSQGKPYRISPLPSAQYPDSGGELTDGDRDYRWESVVGWTSAAGPVTCTIDSGEVFQIETIEAFFMRDRGSAVELPASVEASLSVDGNAFSSVGPLMLDSFSAEPADSGILRYTLECTTSARFVRLTMIPGAGWLMPCEFQFSGRETGADSGWNVR